MTGCQVNGPLGEHEVKVLNVDRNSLRDRIREILWLMKHKYEIHQGQANLNATCRNAKSEVSANVWAIAKAESERRRTLAKSNTVLFRLIHGTEGVVTILICIVSCSSYMLSGKCFIDILNNLLLYWNVAWKETKLYVHLRIFLLYRI